MMFVSHPLLGLLSQFPNPVLQLTTTQAPPEHCMVAFGAEQTAP
jgi:hypothetical protein